MYYIVLDLEFNQDFSDISVKEIIGHRYPFEIIQVGAVKLDFNLDIIGSFNRYVKPDIYKRVNPIITDITGITTDMLMNEKKFLKFIMNLFNSSKIQTQYFALGGCLISRSCIKVLNIMV